MANLGLGRILGEVEALADWTKRRVRGDRGRGPFRIVPYRGHGTEQTFRLRGRVLEGKPIPPASTEDSAWRNLVHTLRRIDSDEVPAARVRAVVGDLTHELLADDEGYFEMRFDLEHPIPSDEIWRPVELELLDPSPESGPLP
jgi:phosphatidate phosphatase APP1